MVFASTLKGFKGPAAAKSFFYFFIFYLSIFTVLCTSLSSIFSSLIFVAINLRIIALHKSFHLPV